MEALERGDAPGGSRSIVAGRLRCCPNVQGLEIGIAFFACRSFLPSFDATCTTSVGGRLDCS